MCLVATGGDASARAAKEATATIPDCLQYGRRSSQGWPGSAVSTGQAVTSPALVVLTEMLEPKRLELLHEIVPGVDAFWYPR